MECSARKPNCSSGMIWLSFTKSLSLESMIVSVILEREEEAYGSVVGGNFASVIRLWKEDDYCGFPFLWEVGKS